MATVEELLEKAERFAGQQRWEEAALVARQAVDTVPEHRWAKDKLGWYLSRAKKHADAIEVYSLLVQEAPENPKYPYMLGYQYYDQQDFTNAVPWFRKALDLKPDYLVVLYRCGYALVKTGDVRAAEALLRDCVRYWRELEEGDAKDREKKNYADACFQLGKIYSDRDDWVSAVKAFTEAVAHESNDADKLYNLGKALVKVENFEEALAALLKADQIAPRKHYIQTYLAIAHHQLNNLVEAERIFDGIPSHIKDQFPYIWQHHAGLYRTQGRTSDAIRMLRAATRRPNEKGLHSWYDIFILLATSCEEAEDIQGAYIAYQGANTWHVKSRGKDSPIALKKIKDLKQVASERSIDLESTSTAAYSSTDAGQSNAQVAYIKKFFTDKGYGFIQQTTGDDLFVHIRNIINSESIREGARVEYQIGQGRKGPEATHVHIID
ncbi:tetratricopeptide repeat protein [Anaerolineae bacterium CFX9]|nr:hypothetical protein [Anaerolineae bacterium]MDL1899140.1 tetratricopeptide repeat protein [Anaerolineae bacterium CFX9]NOG48752.1 tetratricopeptide repeat protein [Chloroflexota bacterium]GIK76115.1 MAG: hypothetical protein BroJett021_51030 [Chloroflexota bacterium]